MTTLEAGFWLCSAVVAWELFIFPVILRLIAKLRPRPTSAADITPSVTVVITTHNEATNIARKIEDTLALEYPAAQLDFLVADDGSDDGTDQVIQRYADRGIKLLRQEQWLGKTAAQNLAAACATGEIIFFTDATALLSPNSLRAMVRHFADPQVGCVTGWISWGKSAVSSDPSIAAGLKGRNRYEEEVRNRQAQAFSLFGATGCIYAVRRSLYIPLAEDQVSDLVLPLLLLECGYRTVHEPAAMATLERALSPELEFRRRSRVVLQCLRAMWHMRRILWPGRVGTFFAAVSWYRLLRWLLPLFLIGILATSTALSILGKSFYMWVLLGQCLLFVLALLARFCKPLSTRVPVVNVVFLFFWINFAALAAIFRLLAGEKGITWSTARGR